MPASTKSIYLAFLLPFVGGSQSAVEQFGGRAVGADRIAPAEQVVNLAWRRVEPLNRSAFAEATPKAFASGRARQVKRYRVKASLTRSSDESERFRRRSFQFRGWIF